MDHGIEIRVFFEKPGEGGITGSRSRRFPLMPEVGQTLVFGKPTATIAVFRVIETGFFLWADRTSAWILVREDEGEHAAPSGFYDPLARTSFT